MGATTALKNQLITELFEKGVQLINQMVKLDQWKKEFFPNEDRTLALYIEEMEELPTGFVFESGKIRTMDKLKDIPTLSVYLTEDVFLSIATEEYTLQSAFFYRWIKLKGDNYLRDFKVFQVMFDRHPEVLAALNPNK